MIHNLISLHIPKNKKTKTKKQKTIEVYTTMSQSRTHYNI